jgi:predicted metalloprotease
MRNLLVDRARPDTDSSLVLSLFPGASQGATLDELNANLREVISRDLRTATRFDRNCCGAKRRRRLVTLSTKRLQSAEAANFAAVVDPPVRRRRVASSV